MSRDSRPVDPADRELEQAADVVIKYARLVVTVEAFPELVAHRAALRSALAEFDKAKARVKT